jgi:beta-glucosidase
MSTDRHQTDARNMDHATKHPPTAFPDDFVWGAATAALQIEGHPLADGAGPGIWHRFCQQPGRTHNDDTPDRGCDSYHRFAEDIRWLKWLGLRHYRFGISWARIFPEGTGRINEAGCLYYERLIDALLQEGIEPWMSLFHWDLPQALEDRWGGWESRDTAEALGTFAAYVSKRFSDRVKHFFTVNEISSFINSGYRSGKFAPGKRLSAQRAAQAEHHACLAHGYAVQGVRAEARSQCKVGMVDVVESTVPIIETEPHIEATRRAFRHFASSRLVPMMEGAYPAEWLEEKGADAPRFTAEDMAIIGTPVDFVGINMYAPHYIAADASEARGFRVVPHQEGHPHLNMPWAKIGPEITYWLPRLIEEAWHPPAIYITENGCACEDKLDHEGRVEDTARVFYLREHFRSAARAAREGIPLKGYFVWSLLDNFEWAHAYSKRFGLLYTNYSTMERIPKRSAEFFREVVQRNHLV